MKQVGIPRDQTLGAMIRIKDILGLDVESQVLVINPESGQVA